MTGNVRPSDQELLEENILYFMQAMRTGIPGKIIKTDGKKATVQPLVNRLFNGESKSQAVITDVPVWRLGTQTARMSVPLNANGGDYCIINFCERPIDTWALGDGKAATPKDGGHHESRGAWCLVGLEPFSSDAIDLENLVVEMNKGTDKECSITMTPKGKISMVSPLEVEIKAPKVQVLSDVVNINAAAAKALLESGTFDHDHGFLDSVGTTGTPTAATTTKVNQIATP